MLSYETIEKIIFTQRIIEFLSCIICFALNSYFAQKFGKISILNSNLRILLVSIHITTAVIALIHPTVQLIPVSWYAVDNGQTLKAIFVYTLLFVTQVCVYLIDTKFLMVAIERHIAIHERVNYEKRDGTLAKRILFWTFSHQETSLDELLQLSLNIEHSPAMLICPHVVAVICWFIGAVKFHYLQVFTQENYYNGKTLSEAYQIKQVDAVIKILKPLIVAYALLVACCCCLLVMVLYFVYIRGISLHSPFGLIFVNAIYINVAWYNLFSTGFLFFYYQPLRNAVIKDIYIISGIRLKQNEVAPEEQLNAEALRENHFEYLRNVWK
ncbi:hypothetical protein M3Y95_00130600 [Aphelenchoides besseyi]|nr:hypothetical protein M3Y95_00130600 [Aphelenchoides besseyi]